MKRTIGRNDQRIKEAEAAKKGLQLADKTKKAKETAQYVEQTPSNLFFNANNALGPPYHVIVDTNFINHSLRNKLDLLSTMMDL
jgi:U3 small nucleolar RNA-associated protein 24